MGIGEPARNATDTYERGMKIVPECISPNEGEIPVKQYDISVMRNPLRFERSEGRLQITNKRAIFRAVGRSVGGRTTLQQEFAIDELSGIEAHRNYRFGFIYLLIGIIVFSLMAAIGGGIFTSLNEVFTENRRASVFAQIERADDRYRADREQIQQRHSGDSQRMQEELRRLDERHQNNRERLQNRLRGSSISFFGVVMFIIGLAGLAAFFLLRKRWLLKLAILGISSAAFAGGMINVFFSFFAGNTGGIASGMLSIIFGFLTLLLSIIGLALYCLKPNLVLLIKTKGGLEGAAPIKIQRSRAFWSWKQDEGTGFAEVFPTDETESAIREINAIINDIQKLGDHGVNKWQQ